jgi:hypothetical protein
MDEELKSYFGQLRTYLDGRFAAIDAKFVAIDANFAAIDAKFAEVRAEIEATETRLLTEFWKWGRMSDQRTRRVEQSDAITAERLAGLEDRIFTLERKMAGSKE